MPLVSVFMPVFNGEKFIAAGIDSILAQTFTDFEFIIVDDGSDDGSAEIIRAYTGRDERIRFIQLTRNMGLSAARNRGVEAARGRFFANMDCDDISMPQRLQKQLDLLKAQPEIGMVGTHAVAVDADTEPLYDLRPPLRHASIVWEKYMGTPFVHTSMMIRLKLVKDAGCYDEGMRYSADTDLTTRLLGRTRFANIAERLLLYRIYEGQQTSHENPKRRRDIQLMKERQFERLFGDAPPGLVRRYDQLKFAKRLSWGERRAARQELARLIDAIVDRNWVRPSEKPELVHAMDHFLESALPRRVQQFLHWRRYRLGF